MFSFPYILVQLGRVPPIINTQPLFPLFMLVVSKAATTTKNRKLRDESFHVHRFVCINGWLTCTLFLEENNSRGWKIFMYKNTLWNVCLSVIVVKMSTQFLIHHRLLVLNIYLYISIYIYIYFNFVVDFFNQFCF